MKRVITLKQLEYAVKKQEIKEAENKIRKLIILGTDK